MRVWLVKLEEDLPIDDAPYHHRMTMLADSLHQKGHEVVRWASAHNHSISVIRSPKSIVVSIKERYKIHLMRCILFYKKGTSYKRIIHIYLSSLILFFKFLKVSKTERPDIIVCSMPAPITCMICAIYSKLFNIRLVIDARDMWPHILKDEAKRFKKLLFYPIYILMTLELKVSTRRAKAIYGITDEFVDYGLKFSNRNKTHFDKSFPLGFVETLQCSESESLAFWVSKGVSFLDTKIVYFAGEISNTSSAALISLKQSLKKAEKEKLNFLFVICGDGAKLSELRSQFNGINNAKVVGRVQPKFLGYLKKRSTLALLSIANRLDYESSLSNKFFDYMSGGLPVLTNLNGVPKNFITKNKIGFHYVDADDFFIILKKLATDSSELDAMSKKSLYLYKTKYSSDVIYSKYSSALENLFEAT